MKRFSEQLNKKAQSVKLRVAEKRELRERVVSYMEYHPLPKDMKVKRVIQEPKLFTEEYKEVALPFKHIVRWLAGAAAIVIIAVPFAAERSVPGDGLYAVKRFNEEVRGTLAFNTIQKVEWETELLNRRISEARLLASEGRLTDEVEAEVAEAVRTQSQNVQKNIAVLRTEDEDEATLASLAFETTLAVQSAALTEESEVDEAGMVIESDSPSVLATVVGNELKETNAANASSTIPAFDKVMAKVEINTTRVYELRDSLVDTATTEQIAEITRRIEDIERSVAKAIALRTDDDGAARKLLVDSLQRTQKLVVFMTDIEVSQSVDIEEIVPVVLTEEEEQAILAVHETELAEKLIAIEAALLEATDGDLVAKATSVLDEIDQLMEQFGSVEDFSERELAITSSLDLTQNLFTLLEINQSKNEPELEGIELPETVSTTTSTTTEETASSTENTLVEEDETEDSEQAEDQQPPEETNDDTPSTTGDTTDLSTDQVDTE